MPIKNSPSAQGSLATTEQDQDRLILVGAQDDLPLQHFWFETDGYSIYAAEQPASSWSQHVHNCTQITIGLEPAHVQASWINAVSSSKSADKREIAGNIVSIIPPGQPHSTVWQRRAVLIHLYISQALLIEAAAELHEGISPELRPVFLGRDIFIEELGRVLFRECRARSDRQTSSVKISPSKISPSNTSPSKLFADSVIQVLATYLLRNYSLRSEPATTIPGGLGPTRERRLREYVEASLDQDLSIGALAALVGMNPRYFANAFRLTTGFTPHRYVTLRRIDHAQRLLADPALSLSRIAYQCGFKSQGQFTTLFRQITGETPGKFRLRFQQPVTHPSKHPQPPNSHKAPAS